MTNDKTNGSDKINEILQGLEELETELRARSEREWTAQWSTNPREMQAWQALLEVSFGTLRKAAEAPFPFPLNRRQRRMIANYKKRNGDEETL